MLQENVLLLDFVNKLAEYVADDEEAAELEHMLDNHEPEECTLCEERARQA